MTTVVLVRHGQTALNQGNRIRGRLDPPLDETGIVQARRVSKTVAGRWPITAVYTSPLRRALGTAQAIASRQGLAAIPFDGLLDLDFGNWHGLSFEQTREQYPRLHEAWQTSPYSVRFPAGECLDDVRERAVRGIADVVARHGDEAVVMVGHTVVNRVIVCAILNVSDEAFWRFAQDTCAINVFEVSASGEMRLTLLNDTSHLAGISNH
jgi:probable phosphoglycerate mutase